MAEVGSCLKAGKDAKKLFSAILGGCMRWVRWRVFGNEGL